MAIRGSSDTVEILFKATMDSKDVLSKTAALQKQLKKHQDNINTQTAHIEAKADKTHKATSQRRLKSLQTSKEQVKVLQAQLNIEQKMLVVRGKFKPESGFSLMRRTAANSIQRIENEKVLHGLMIKQAHSLGIQEKNSAEALVHQRSSIQLLERKVSLSSALAGTQAKLDKNASENNRLGVKSVAVETKKVELKKSGMSLARGITGTQKILINQEEALARLAATRHAQLLASYRLRKANPVTSGFSGLQKRGEAAVDTAKANKKLRERQKTEELTKNINRLGVKAVEIQRQSNALTDKSVSMMGSLTGKRKILINQEEALARLAATRHSQLMANYRVRQKDAALVKSGFSGLQQRGSDASDKALANKKLTERQNMTTQQADIRLKQKQSEMSQKIIAVTSRVTSSINEKNRVKQREILIGLKDQAIKQKNSGLARSLHAEIQKQTSLINKNTAALKRNNNQKLKAKPKAPQDGGFMGTFANEGSSFGHKVGTTLQYATAGSGIYAMVSGFKAAGAAALEFDLIQKRLQAVLSSGNSILDPQHAKKMAVGLENIGAAFGGTISDINEAALALGRAGVANEDLVKGTEQVVKLAMLTGDTIADTTNVLSTFRQTYGDAAGSVTELADALAYAANQSRLSTQDLGTLSNYALSAARATGMTAEQVLAMSTAFSNAGVNASTIGTQIRKFSIMLRQSSPKITKFYDILGLRQSELLHMFQNGESDEAFKKMVETIAGSSTAAYNAATRDLDIRQRDTIDKFRLTADKMLGHLDDLNGAVATGMTDNANIIALSYTKAMERIRNSVLTLTNTEITGALDSVFGKLTSADVTDAARTITVTMKSLVQTVGAATAAWITYRAVVMTLPAAQAAAGLGTFALGRQLVVLRTIMRSLATTTGVVGIALSALAIAFMASNQIKNDGLARRAEALEKVKQKANEAAAAEKKLNDAMWGTNSAAVDSVIKKIESAEKSIKHLKKALEVSPNTKGLEMALEAQIFRLNAWKEALNGLEVEKKKARKEFTPVSDKAIIRLKSMGQLLSNMERNSRTSKLPAFFRSVNDAIKQQSKFVVDLYQKTTKLDLSSLFGNADGTAAMYELDKKLLSLELERNDIATSSIRAKAIEKEQGSLREVRKNLDKTIALRKTLGQYKKQERKDSLVQNILDTKAIENSERFLKASNDAAMGKISNIDVMIVKLEEEKRLLEEINNLETGGKGQPTEEQKKLSTSKHIKDVAKAESDLMIAQHNLRNTLEDDYYNNRVTNLQAYSTRMNEIFGSPRKWFVLSSDQQDLTGYDRTLGPSSDMVAKEREKYKERVSQSGAAPDQQQKYMQEFDSAQSAKAKDKFMSDTDKTTPWVEEFKDRMNATDEYYSGELERHQLAGNDKLALMYEQGASELELLAEYDIQKSEQDELYRKKKLDEDTAYALAGASATSSIATGLANTMEDLRKSGLVKSKKMFKAMQAMQIVAATADTYQNAILGYQRGLEVPYIGMVLGPINAAAAIAAGMANVAQIKAQTYHTGGTVGPNGQKLRSDEVPAVLQTGERVLSRQEVSQTQQAPTNNETVIINSIDPAVIESYMTSRSGRKVINNVVNA